MKLKNVVTKLSVFMMVGVVALSGAATAFAADNNTIVNGNRDLKPQRENFEEMSTIYKSALEKLVSEGTITQAQADAITASKASKECKDGNITSSAEHKNHMQDRASNTAQREKQKNHFCNLVSEGTITQVQLDAIQEAMKAARDSGKTMSDVLTELVSAETITQAQADAITANMPARDGKTVKAIEQKNPYSELVSAGTITQTQADTLWNTIKEAMQTARASEKQ